MKAADASTFNEGVILFRLCPSTVLLVLRTLGKVDLGAEPRILGRLWTIIIPGSRGPGCIFASR